MSATYFEMHKKITYWMGIWKTDGYIYISNIYIYYIYDKANIINY